MHVPVNPRQLCGIFRVCTCALAEHVQCAREQGWRFVCARAPLRRTTAATFIPGLFKQFAACFADWRQLQEMMALPQAGFLSCTFCGGFCYVGIIGARVAP